MNLRRKKFKMKRKESKVKNMTNGSMPFYQSNHVEHPVTMKRRRKYELSSLNNAKRQKVAQCNGSSHLDGQILANALQKKQQRPTKANLPSIRIPDDMFNLLMQQLKCQICMDNIVDSAYDLCGHVGCRECLEEFIRCRWCYNDIKGIKSVF